MKLKIFPSGPGDCLLLTGADGKRVLIDGGEEYADVVGPHLASLGDEKIDVVYVSHDDGDHIKGILELFEDMKAWRFFRFQSEERNNPRVKAPSVPEPPQVGAVWHNAFSDLLPEDFKPMFEAVSQALSMVCAIPPDERARMTAQPGLRASAPSQPSLETSVADIVDDYSQFASSQRQSHELSRLIGRNLLRIPVNPDADGGLMVRREDTEDVVVGGMTFRLLGPRPKDIDKLREIYKEWLEENQSELEEIRRETGAEGLLSSGDFTDFVQPFLEQATKFGRRSRVTPPNHASLMFWVEEGDGKTLLLTGDGHHEAILESMRDLGLIGEGVQAHVHVHTLKVPHHGSEHNVDADFFRKITADHYVFCGNGAHHNPDLGVLELCVRSRLDHPDAPAGADDEPRFHLWFSAHHTTANTDSRKKHMREVEAKVEDLRNEVRDRFTFEAHYMTAEIVERALGDGDFDFPEIET